jgi:hypothetical protein
VSSARDPKVWAFAATLVAGSCSTVALAQMRTWGGGAESPSVGDAGVAMTDAETDAGADADTDAAADAGADAAHRVPSLLHDETVDAGADAGTGEDAGDGGSSGPSELGFAAGVRGAYMLPFGQGNGSPLYGTVLLGAFGVGVDAGWYFSRHFYVGGYFQYGFGIGPGQNNATCSDPNVVCTATVYRFGAVSHWHFQPGSSFDPWIGGGLGYEVVNLSSVAEDDSEPPQAATLQGFDLTLELGLDFKPLPYLGIGPYVELATGPYIGTDSFGMHGWASFGARFRTNL